MSKALPLTPIAERSPDPRMEASRFAGAMQAVEDSAVNRINSAYVSSSSGMPIEEVTKGTTKSGFRERK